MDRGKGATQAFARGEPGGSTVSEANVVRTPAERGGGGMKRSRWVVLLLALAVVAMACTGDDEGGDGGGDGATAPDGGVSQRDFRFVVVTHGQASDPFWSVAANGVGAAAEDM